MFKYQKYLAWLTSYATQWTLPYPVCSLGCTVLHIIFYWPQGNKFFNFPMCIMPLLGMLGYAALSTKIIPFSEVIKILHPPLKAKVKMSLPFLCSYPLNSRYMQLKAEETKCRKQSANQGELKYKWSVLFCAEVDST